MDVLRKQTTPVKDVDENLIYFIERMFKTMDYANGIGLAAPQVNFDKSVAVIDISYHDEYKHIKPMVLINPVILETDGEDTMEEGCLSIPNVRFKVTRPERIFFKYYDLDMKEIRMEADELLARVVQHETDHLNGKLFIDYLTATEKSKIKDDLKKIKKGDIEPDYPLHIHHQDIL